MSDRQPNLYVLAGPNGSGKSTFARLYLPEYADCQEFVNADLIAVSYHNDSLLPTMHTFVQVLIENEKQIPVLTINTEDLTVSSGALYYYMSS